MNKKILRIYLWYNEDENECLAIFAYSYREWLEMFRRSDMVDWSDYIWFKKFINKEHISFRSLRKIAPEWAVPWLTKHERNEWCLRQWIYYCLDEGIICEICWEKSIRTYHNEIEDKLCCSICDD